MSYSSLSNANINAEGIKGEIGIYVLADVRTSNGKYEPKYVGRSTDLDDRLKDHVGDYIYFRYEIFDTEYEAYLREDELYEEFKSQLDNKIKPAWP